MRSLRWFAFGIAVAGLWISGCGKSGDSAPSAPSAPPTSTSAADVPHAHGAGPNGGVVFDLGSHHAEFTVDHGKHQCTILILGDDEKTPTPIAATEFIVNINETKTADGTVVAPMTVTLSPTDSSEGKAATFVGNDPGIGNVADFAGTVSGEIEGKPAMGEFQE